jgi:hypothetical protein
MNMGDAPCAIDFGPAPFRNGSADNSDDAMFYMNAHSVRK